MNTKCWKYHQVYTYNSHLMSMVCGSDSKVISNPVAKVAAAAEEEVVSVEVPSTLWISAMYVVFCIWKSSFQN